MNRLQLSRWHLSRQYLSWVHLSISGISQLWLTIYRPNFKSRFDWPSRTDSNNQGDIYLGKICPGGICPYLEYLSCYWLDFDQTLKLGSRDLFWQTAVKVTMIIFHSDFCLPQYFLGPKIFGTQNLLTKSFVGPK